MHTRSEMTSTARAVANELGVSFNETDFWRDAPPEHAARTLTLVRGEDPDAWRRIADPVIECEEGENG